jgi:uncharacterized membrane protein YqjE
MRQSDIEVRVEQRGDGLSAMHNSPREASLGELLKRLTSDSAELIQQEVELAKSEMRETMAAYAADAAKVGVAAGLAFVGVLALSAFLVIAIGNALGGRYWLSSLGVGIIASGVGYMMVTSAVKDMKQRGLKPRATLQTLREDKAWVSQQAKELKHDLTSNPATPSIRT